MPGRLGVDCSANLLGSATSRGVPVPYQFVAPVHNSRYDTCGALIGLGITAGRGVMRRSTRRRGGILCGLLVSMAGGLLIQGYGPLRTMASLEKIDDQPLYVMHYQGGYHLDLVARYGIQWPVYRQLERLVNPDACTSFVAFGKENDAVFARNFDWAHPSTLVLFTDPPGGYAAVATVDMYYLGLNQLQEIPWSRRATLLAAPYAIMDGMNECGLAISQNAVPGRRMPVRPDRPTLISNQVMRVVLDRASNVDEALALIDDFNVFFPVIACHLHLADAAGKSVVVEFTEGRMVVLRNTVPWQVSTNFLISEERPYGPRSQCRRYSFAYRRLQSLQGELSQERAMELLAVTSQRHTVWSVVYNLDSGRILLASGRDYGDIHEFHLPMRTDEE